MPAIPGPREGRPSSFSDVSRDAWIEWECLRSPARRVHATRYCTSCRFSKANSSSEVFSIVIMKQANSYRDRLATHGKHINGPRQVGSNVHADQIRSGLSHADPPCPSRDHPVCGSTLPGSSLGTHSWRLGSSALQIIAIKF